MKIFYRISPYLSSNPNPMGNDKPRIAVECLMSFLEANKSRYPITFINDGFDKDFVDKYLKPYGEVIKGSGGNVETFHDQLECVLKLDNEEKVMLVEDDYLWAVDGLKQLENALDELSIVFPYDHPGHYTEERFKYKAKQMRLIGDSLYREAPSNTLTFATKAYVIKQNIDLIKSYGVRDHEMFQSLGIDMWCSTPGIATHLVTGLISPGFKLNL